MPEVRVSAVVKPSEEPAKVERAVRAIFPDARLELVQSELRARSETLDRFRELIWKAKILDAARRILLGSLEPDGTRARFSLNKQAAYAGHVSFSVGEAPLGDLQVEVQGHDLGALFKGIAPPTLQGRPVSEEQYARFLEKRRTLKARRKYASREREEE